MSDESQGEKPKRLPQWAQDEIFDKLTQPIETERKQRAEDQLARGRALASAEDASFSSFTLPRWYATDKERELDREAAEVRACFFLVGFLAVAFGLGTLGFGITFILS